MVKYEEVVNNKTVEFPTVALRTLDRIFGGIVYSAREIPADKANDMFVNIFSSKQKAAAIVGKDNVLDCISVLCMQIKMGRDVAMLDGCAYYCPDKDVLLQFVLVDRVLITIQRKSGANSLKHVSYGAYSREQAIELARKLYGQAVQESEGAY